MLILLHGQDTYRSRQKLNEIIERYKKNHQSGLNLSWFTPLDNKHLTGFKEDLNFEKLKETIEAVSMFNEKKLIILEDIFQNTHQDFREKFFQYAQKNGLKENQDIIVVIYEKRDIQHPTSNIKHLFSMSQEFKPLEGFRLVNWIERAVAQQGGQIDKSAAQKLAFYVGHNLWQMTNEINKLISFSQQKSVISDKDIDLLVKPKIETNIFQTIDALGQRDKKTALRLLHEHLEKGENELYLLTMLIYQIRNLLKLKDLAARGTPYYSLAKKTRLHPFVVKKSWDQLKNFNLEQLKKIYQRVLEIDWQLKTGRIDGRTALDILVMEL